MQQIERHRTAGAELVAGVVRPYLWLRKTKLLLPLLPYAPLALGLGLLVRRDALPRLRSAVAFFRMAVFVYGTVRAVVEKGALPGSGDSRGR